MFVLSCWCTMIGSLTAGSTVCPGYSGLTSAGTITAKCRSALVIGMCTCKLTCTCKAHVPVECFLQHAMWHQPSAWWLLQVIGGVGPSDHICSWGCMTRIAASDVAAKPLSQEITVAASRQYWFSLHVVVAVAHQHGVLLQ